MGEEYFNGILADYIAEKYISGPIIKENNSIIVMR